MTAKPSPISIYWNLIQDVDTLKANYTEHSFYKDIQTDIESFYPEFKDKITILDVSSDPDNPRDYQVFFEVDGKKYYGWLSQSGMRFKLKRWK